MMIQNDQELQAMKERIAYFQQQVETLRRVETNAQNYRASAGGFLAEIDRMNLEIREYLSPSKRSEGTSGLKHLTPYGRRGTTLTR